MKKGFVCDSSDILRCLMHPVGGCAGASSAEGSQVQHEAQSRAHPGLYLLIS